jgi:benzoylformate decarboxylase
MDMRGGQVFMESLLLHGVDCIFGNPGTTENPLLDRLLDYPQLPYYVALHEGVAVCAASFHAQATGRPAVANLHVPQASRTPACAWMRRCCPTIWWPWPNR